MIRLALGLSCVCLVFSGCGPAQQPCTPAERDTALVAIDSLGTSLDWPTDLDIKGFAGPGLTPSPACMAVAPTGAVFVGVDMIGSLGKDPGKGRIIRIEDCNADGVMDSHTTFASVNNPRGIFPLGDRLFVLHTVFEDDFASGMDLVVFQDEDRDGIADGPSQTLIKGISNPQFLQSRGTDHATNGIRMGIDGWIYIAVGDFGFHNATDQAGNKLTMLGGGIVRVRPDGTEMEVYTHGLRNIYDMAIDPYMNIFVRGNTNDGGGWNIRFSHQVQSGEYGYPVLFKHFTEEIIPAMIDLGGGSGTGALFIDEPTWPDKYNQVPMMADWGRSQLYIHQVNPVGGSFDQKEEPFIKLPQITDVDIDGSGRMYLSAWDGAGYSGDSTKGFIVRVVPEGWTYTPFPDLEKASTGELQSLLKSESSTGRLYAQQELLTRNPTQAAEAAWEVASDAEMPLNARVAGIFTYAQAAREKAVENLLSLVEDKTVREYALRALADRKPFLEDVPIDPFLEAVGDSSARVQIAAIVGLGRLGKAEAAGKLLTVPVPPSFKAPIKGEEGPHATPNPEIIPAHVAVKSLVELQAVTPCVEAIGSGNTDLALWALRYMYDARAVDGLIAAYSNAANDSLKKEILTTLARLYHKEAPYDASWWWSTRPDTHGPFYQPVTWESSEKIRAFLLKEWDQTPPSEKAFFADLNGKLRLGISRFGGEEAAEIKLEQPTVDLEKIRNKKGQIGESSIEDIMLAMAKIKGSPELGEKLFVQQGCVACHSVDDGEAMKGPFMGQIGSIMSRRQIAESILKPNASISQGFSTTEITTAEGETYMGFITGESAGKLTLRDITGAAHVINTADIQERKELETSVMPEGLAGALSYEEFASLITYLSEQKE